MACEGEHTSWFCARCFLPNYIWWTHAHSEDIDSRRKNRSITHRYLPVCYANVSTSFFNDPQTSMQTIAARTVSENSERRKDWIVTLASFVCMWERHRCYFPPTHKRRPMWKVSVELAYCWGSIQCQFVPSSSSSLCFFFFASFYPSFVVVVDVLPGIGPLVDINSHRIQSVIVVSSRHCLHRLNMNWNPSNRVCPLVSIWRCRLSAVYMRASRERTFFSQW